MRRLFFLLLVVVLVAVPGFLAFRDAGEFLVSPASAPVKADLIVVLGGDAGARSLKGAELFQSGYARHVLLTGLEEGEQETQPYYLNWRAQVLEGRGVPRDALLFDTASRNSWEEARNTAALMEARGWREVLVVSDPPHMRRLDWVWGKAFTGTDLRYTLVAGVPRWWIADAWWRNEPSAKFVVNEYVKLGYYFFAH